MYTDHIDYLMFFKDSVRGLQPGAPVEFGVFAGTVSKSAILCADNASDIAMITVFGTDSYRARAAENGSLAKMRDVVEHLGELLKRGLRGSLKPETRSLALYVDLDFYPNTPAITGIP